MNYSVIDLFCGIGGFSKGFEKAGFDVLFGLDNWDIALETFQRNHQGTKVINEDICEIDENFYKQYAGKVDVIIGGPPCQGFSMSGKRDPNDKRNTLFEAMIKIVSIVQPKITVLENVVGLLSMNTPDGVPVKDEIIRRFNEIGYTVTWKILNAADYGVPQKRQRVIFLASRIGDVVFPSNTHSGDKITEETWITVGNALGNIPNVDDRYYLSPATKFQKKMGNGTKLIHNHEAVKHAPKIIERMSYVPQGGNWKDIPPEYYGVGGEHSNNYRRLDPQKPSITLKHATKSMIIHPMYDRCLTVREVARLQSFYDSFIIYGSKSEQYQQLANAVPPLLGFAIAKEIHKCLKNQKSE